MKKQHYVNIVKWLLGQVVMMAMFDRGEEAPAAVHDLQQGQHLGGPASPDSEGWGVGGERSAAGHEGTTEVCAPLPGCVCHAGIPPIGVHKGNCSPFQNCVLPSNFWSFGNKSYCGKLNKVFILTSLHMEERMLNEWLLLKFTHHSSIAAKRWSQEGLTLQQCHFIVCYLSISAVCIPDLSLQTDGGPQQHADAGGEQSQDSGGPAVHHLGHVCPSAFNIQICSEGRTESSSCWDCPSERLDYY